MNSSHPLIMIIAIPFMMFFIIGTGIALTEVYLFFFRREHFKKSNLMLGLFAAFFGFLGLFFHETKFDKHN